MRYFGEVDIFRTRVKISSCLQQCKNYKNRSRVSKVTITNVLPAFYGSQCTKFVIKWQFGTCIRSVSLTLCYETDDCGLE